VQGRGQVGGLRLQSFLARFGPTPRGRGDRSPPQMGTWSCETPVTSTACPNANAKRSINAPLGEAKTVGPNPAQPHRGPTAIRDHRCRQLEGQRPPGRRLRLSRRPLATTGPDRPEKSMPPEARAPARSGSFSEPDLPREEPVGYNGEARRGRGPVTRPSAPPLAASLPQARRLLAAPGAAWPPEERTT
jgi:hypothetical protein